MRPPVEKTRSLLAEDAGIARTMRAILASRGKASSWSFQKASTSTLRPGLGSVSYLRISCSRPVSLPTSPLSLLKMSLELRRWEKGKDWANQLQGRRPPVGPSMKVVEFLETNMGMVEDNLGQGGNNLEEAWGNLVEEYFSGDNVPAKIPILKLSKLICTLKTAHLAILITINHTANTILIFDIVSKVIVGAIILLISLPNWLLATTALQTTPINKMPSFYFSKFCYSQSQGSRREREFSSLNLRVRDENEIFSHHLRVREKMDLILTRIREIEKSCYALLAALDNCI